MSSPAFSPSTDGDNNDADDGCWSTKTKGSTSFDRTSVGPGEYVLLRFSDRRLLFARTPGGPASGAHLPLKINKKSYSSADILGVKYGAVLEVQKGTAGHFRRGGKGKSGGGIGGKLVVLPVTEDLLPSLPEELQEESPATDADREKQQSKKDNRNLVDNNTAQSLDQNSLAAVKRTALKNASADDASGGAAAVAALVANSTTYRTKTAFSRAKYVRSKQLRHQLRCRVERTCGHSICEAFHVRDARKIMNLRPDTLSQIMGNANIYGGCRVMVFENVMGIIVGTLAQRMGGFGAIVALHDVQSPSCGDTLDRFNLTCDERRVVRWIHCSEMAREDRHTDDSSNFGADLELEERKALVWPCELQEHTKAHIARMDSDERRFEFLRRRADRFARKLTRHASTEIKSAVLADGGVDSLIVASKYDPVSTTLRLLPHLSPSGSFVVYCEYLELLLELFRALQEKKLAIKMRLSDTWMREYQVLAGRTHPQMNMGQNGGFLLSGIKLGEDMGFEAQLRESSERKRSRGGFGKQEEEQVDKHENGEKSKNEDWEEDSRKSKHYLEGDEKESNNATLKKGANVADDGDPREKRRKEE
uniref:tRNA (adenine(58)-N(1))-methyltransferase non-catalytic subunit TRM6 n=1 Tax=Corethron hystrix TaxID=216773 RepID=A0A7S1BA98_9STRA